MEDYFDEDEAKKFEHEDEYEEIKKFNDEGPSGEAARVPPVYPTEIDGMVRINLSELTQKIVGCEIGENVTTEYPWIFVKKEIIEDNLDLHVESSDFLPVRDEIFQYPKETLLIGLAPTRTNDPEFYICLTEDSRDIVVNQIEVSRNDQENRVKNAVFRETSHWNDLGSGKNVDESTIINTRPLFQSEVVVNVDFFKAPIQLVDRNTDEQRDGYTELITIRQTFNNVTRRLVSRGDDTNPEICDKSTQTSSSKPLNSWFQYTYDYKPINTQAYNDEETRAIQKFLRTRTTDISDKVLMNTAWDIHTDECKKLVKNEKDIQIPVAVVYTEYQNYHNIEITKEKIINDLCWHPLWTGIAMAAYTDHSKSENLTEKSAKDDQVLKACRGENYVLIWSFNDCLKPKLILQCFREVTTISVKPLDGNIVVGACSNGQIAIWDISGQIESVETVKALTAEQAKYKMAMKNLIKWGKESTGFATIYPTAMSSIQSSQKGPITQIIWLSTHTRIGQNGRFVQLDRDTDIKQVGWQLVTSSEDGTVAFWDLRIPEDTERQDMMRKDKKKRKVQAHEAEVMKQSFSPLKALDDVLTPTYMLLVKHPEEERRVIITTMSLYVPRDEKVQIEPYSKDTDITTRKYYKPIMAEPNHDMSKIIFIGTLEGDVGAITWDGFEFANSLTMNREVTTWIWRNTMIHDGPVTHSVRSKHLHDVIVTVGGKAFGVWRDNFSEPIFMKQSTVRYTACSWGTSRPTVIIVGRADGTVEIWDLIVKSHEPCFTQSLSGGMITGIYTHELYLNPQCVAFCDFNGAMRIFFAPANLLLFEESHVKWMRSFVDREVDRIQEFHDWQRSWSEKNTASIEKQKIQQEKEKQREKEQAEAEEKNRTEMAETTEKIGLAQPKRKPGQFIEEGKNRWNAMELKRMQQIILKKKGLRADDLDKRQAPVLKLRREAKLKKKRVEETLQQKNKIFDDTLNFLFPERNYEPEQELEIHDAYDSPNTAKTEKNEIEALIERVKIEQTREESEAILKEYNKISEETLRHMKEHPFKEFFDWRKMMSEGEHRRRSLDVDLKSIQKKRNKAPTMI